MPALVPFRQPGAEISPCLNLSDVIPRISTRARFGTVSGVQHESNLLVEFEWKQRWSTRL